MEQAGEDEVLRAADEVEREHVFGAQPSGKRTFDQSKPSTALGAGTSPAAAA